MQTCALPSYTKPDSRRFHLRSIFLFADTEWPVAERLERDSEAFTLRA
jgi:hypothetical protein